MSMESRDQDIARAERIIQQLVSVGIPEETILKQLNTYVQGFPAAHIVRPCVIGDGIAVIEEQECEALLSAHAQAAGQGRFTKFVPASGAATRMFKSLAALTGREPPLDDASLSQGVASGDEDSQQAREFFDALDRFAFFPDLNAAADAAGLDLAALLRAGSYDNVLKLLLRPEGLNYGSLPKGLIPFHRYATETRTPFTEHLVEAATYAADAQGVARVHFTVPPDHLAAVERELQRAAPSHAREGGRIEITLSTQKSSSVTIAVDTENQPFRSDDDLLLFRPAGHGALLANLEDLQGDLVFIKNIDNVIVDSLKQDTDRYKRLLGGLLVMVQQRVFDFLRTLGDAESPPAEWLDEVRKYSAQVLNLREPAALRERSAREQAQYWFEKLNRPLRVCGMVRNAGQPGGGPFWVREGDTETVQIVEQAQIDLDDPEQREAFSRSTHFNPVDLVCGLRDFQGKPFQLSDYVNPDTGFITAKSKDGKTLKAMELPGLWNGSMACWNTVLVEVPSTTFSPVKTVNDLLRPEHQAS